MTPVWDVSPHPDATDREGPDSFREHDIRPFGGGMTPPSWPLVAAQVQHWVESACVTGDKIHAGEDLDRPLVEELARLHNEFERSGRTATFAASLRARWGEVRAAGSRGQRAAADCGRAAA
jgi:hypothetical protein